MKKYLKDLKELKVNEEEDLENKERFYAASMITFSIMNRCIDPGSEIISARNFGMPSSYRDIFEYLYREKVIDKEVRNNMIKLVYYRNLIAHEYRRITEKEILALMRGIGTSEKFIEQIKEFIKTKNSS